VNNMTSLRRIAVVLLWISIFCNVDLGLNLLASLIPGMYDGIGYYSILQPIFGIFGDVGWSSKVYFYAFARSVWATFALSLVNYLLYKKLSK